MNSKIKGITALLIATYTFSFYGIFSRFMSSDFGPIFQTTARSAVCIILLLVLSRFFPLKKIQKEDYKWFITQGLFAVVTNVIFYPAVINLPLGTAMFIFYASSLLFSYLFGSLVLLEKITLKKIVAFILAIVGIFLIYKSSFKPALNLYLLFSIIAGGSFGLYSSSSKKINNKYNALQIALVLYLINFIVTVILLAVIKEPIFLDFTSLSWSVNLLFAVSSIITTFTVVYGFKFVEAQIGGLLMLSELIFVVLNGFIFFREVPTFWVSLGGLLIFVAMCLPYLRFKMLK